MSSESSHSASNQSRSSDISASPVTRTLSSVLPENPASVRLEEPTTAAPGSAWLSYQHRYALACSGLLKVGSYLYATHGYHVT